jgi:rRNA maturation RNase YbeY
MNNQIQFFSEEISYLVKQKTLLRKWISAVIQSEGFKAGPINVIFCRDQYLHKINVEYLDHDTYTDIITFDYSTGSEISGDLFISLERIRENAKQFSIKSIDELHRVIIHGILHLCGFGDKTADEKEIMREKENIYLVRRPDKLKAS